MSELDEWLVADYPLEGHIKYYINEIYSWCNLHYISCTDLTNEVRLASRNIIINFSELVEVDKNIYIILLCGLYENKENIIKIFNIISDKLKCIIIDALDLITHKRYIPSTNQIKDFYKLREIQLNKLDNNIICDELKEFRNYLLNNLKSKSC